MTTETYAGLAATILARPPRLGATRLVAVDGPSGAGKTVFASRLAAAFEPAPPVVHTDDLLDGWDDQFTFWTRLESRVLGAAARGAGRALPAVRLDAAAFGDAWIAVPPAPVVILEGVSAARAAIRPELTFAVFVTAPRDLRLRRTLRRDGEELRPYLERWRLRRGPPLRRGRHRRARRPGRGRDGDARRTYVRH